MDYRTLYEKIFGHHKTWITGPIMYLETRHACEYPLKQECLTACQDVHAIQDFYT